MQRSKWRKSHSIMWEEFLKGSDSPHNTCLWKWSHVPAMGAWLLSFSLLDLSPSSKNPLRRDLLAIKSDPRFSSFFRSLVANKRSLTCFGKRLETIAVVWAACAMTMLCCGRQESKTQKNWWFVSVMAISLIKVSLAGFLIFVHLPFVRPIDHTTKTCKWWK